MCVCVSSFSSVYGILYIWMIFRTPLNFKRCLIGTVTELSMYLWV